MRILIYNQIIFFLDKKIIMSLSNSENPLEDYWKKRRQINKQYDKKKEIEKKYLDDIKQLDDEYEAAIKNWISAKKIILQYLDEREKQNNLDNLRISSVRSQVKEKESKNTNANISHPQPQPQSQRFGIANNFNNINSKNNLEMKTPEEERKDSPEELKDFDINNNKNKKRKQD